MNPELNSALKTVIFLKLLLGASLLFGQISSSVSEGCSPLVGVQFQNFYAGATGVSWTFGNGASSTAQNPTITYQNPGVYTVTFTADGGIFDQLEINVQASPTALFAAVSSTQGCIPLNVSFEDQSTASAGAELVHWSWDFGDGSVNNGLNANPNHTYTLVGINDVTLVVEDDNGCEGAVSLSELIVTSIPPTAAILSEPLITTSCTPPLLVNFDSEATSNSPQGDDLTYFWDLGNGEESNNANPPSENYTENGDYPITLTITDDVGCENVLTTSVFIGSPQADWNFIEGPSFCDTVYFVNSSDIAQTNIAWGDGAMNFFFGFTDTLMHVYTEPGDYEAVLEVSSPGCSDESTVNFSIDDTEVSFFSSPNFSCQTEFNVEYTGISLNAETYEWIFGPDTLYGQMIDYTHIHPSEFDPYFQPGPTLFGPTLNITTAAGCTNSITIQQDTIWPPYAGFGIDIDYGCVPLQVTFSDSSSAQSPITNWEWHMGDGTIINLTPMVDSLPYTYTEHGDFDSFLVITTEEGCIDTSAVIPIQVGIPSNPQVNFGPIQVCPGESVDFSAFIDDLDYEVDYWHFESDSHQSSNCPSDGESSHAFSAFAGLHDLTVYSNYNGCIDQTTYTDAIEVLGPVGHFVAIMNCDDPFTVEFVGSMTSASSWTYDFGDGQVFASSTESTVSHTYDATGDYTITLTSSNPGTGCPDFVESYDLSIRDIHAELEASALVICEGGEIQLSGANSSDVFSNGLEGYLWLIDPQLNTAPYRTAENTISVQIDEAGIYEFSLVTQDFNLCRDTAQVQVNVSSIEANFDFSTLSPCLPMEVDFEDLSVSDTTIVSWTWDFDNGLTSTLQNPSTIFNNPDATWHSVSLTVSDTLGCSDDVLIPVFPEVPDASFSNTNPNLCAGDSVTFTANNLGYTEYNWDFGNGTTGTGTSITVAYINAGTYDVTLDVISPSTCTDTNEVLNLVTVQAYPDVGYSTNVDDLEHLCYPILIEFTDTTTASIFDYRDWDIGTGFPVVNSQTVGAIYDTPGTYLVSLEVGTTFGCIGYYEQEYLVEGPFADFEMSTDEICLFESVTLSIIDSSGVSAFMWDFGNGVDSMNVSPVTYFYNEIPTDGSTVIQLISWSGDFACSATTEYPFTVHQTIANFNRNLELTVEDSIHCFGIVDHFENTSQNTNSYTWDFGDGGTSGLYSPNHLYAEGGQYDVWLHVSNTETGCRDSILKPMVIFPEMEVSAENGLECEGSVLSVSATGGVEYEWFPPDGLDDPSSDSPTIIDGENHNLTVSITDENGCVEDLPVTADFIFIPPTQSWLDTTVTYGNPLNFEYPVEPYHSYQWILGSGNNCSSCNDEFYFPQADNSYMLVITDDLGCTTDTIHFNVFVLDDLIFYMPNAFSPNDDGVNDFLYPVMTRAHQDGFEYSIWNRNGERIWHTTDVNQRWAGAPLGSKYYSEIEVYIWKIRVNDLRGLAHDFQGHVTMVR